MVVLRFTLLIYVATQLPLWAHGDLHGRIAQCTREIQQEPARAELYLKRAELYRLHGERDLALADCAQVEKLTPKTAAADLLRGRIFFDAGEWKTAEAALDIFLVKQPQHSEALLTRARALVKLKQYPAAEKDFTAAIRNSATVEPDYFLERAQALLADGKIGAALTALDEGIEKLGTLVSLERLAIDLEVRQKHFDRALARVEKISAHSARKESWLVLRGEVLESAGKKAEARAAFQEAFAAIESLPAGRRETKTCQDLQSKIKTALERLREDPQKS